MAIQLSQPLLCILHFGQIWISILPERELSRYVFRQKIKIIIQRMFG